jgi:hypothetical protein
MSHTVKHTPASTVCTVRAGAGRRFKRLQHKRERALVRRTLCAGFRLAAGQTHLPRGGKMHRRDAVPADLRQ